MCKVRSFKKLDDRVRILLGIQTFFDDLYPRQGTVGIRSPGHGMLNNLHSLFLKGFHREDSTEGRTVLRDKRTHTLGG